MQQHDSKDFARIPPSPTDIGGVVKRSKFNIFRPWPCCVSNLRESHIQQHGSKYFAHRAKVPKGSKGQNSTFTGTWSCCILNLRKQHMQQHTSKYFANIPLFPHTIPHPDPVGWVKIQLFQNTVMLHIK